MIVLIWEHVIQAQELVIVMMDVLEMTAPLFVMQATLIGLEMALVMIPTTKPTAYMMVVIAVAQMLMISTVL